MKKFMSLMLGLTLVMGTAVFAADEKPADGKEKKASKKKASKKKKADAPADATK